MSVDAPSSENESNDAHLDERDACLTESCEKRDALSAEVENPLAESSKAKIEAAKKAASAALEHRGSGLGGGGTAETDLTKGIGGVLGAPRDGGELDGVFGSSNLETDLTKGIGGVLGAPRDGGALNGAFGSSNLETDLTEGIEGVLGAPRDGGALNGAFGTSNLETDLTEGIGGVLGAPRDGGALNGAFGSSNLETDLTKGIGGVLGKKVPEEAASAAFENRISGLGGGGTAETAGGLRQPDLDEPQESEND